MQPADLVEIHAIERLKYTYLRCLDQKLWDELEGCFTEDATASYGGGAAVFNDRDGIMEFLRTAMGSTSMLTSHKCHHPEIDLTGPDTAKGVWALEDVVVLSGKGGAGGVTIRGAAFYTDDYVKVGGEWRIKHTGYKRTYEEIQSRDGVPGLRLTADWFETDGRSSLI
jgi:hypothetical protein